MSCGLSSLACRNKKETETETETEREREREGGGDTSADYRRSERKKRRGPPPLFFSFFPIVRFSTLEKNSNRFCVLFGDLADLLCVPLTQPPPPKKGIPFLKFSRMDFFSCCCSLEEETKKRKHLLNGSYFFLSLLPEKKMESFRSFVASFDGTTYRRYGDEDLSE